MDDSVGILRQMLQAHAKHAEEAEAIGSNNAAWHQNRCRALQAAITALESSPAHTSEAMDAELLDWLRVNEFDLVTRREDIGEDEYAIWWFVVDYRKSTRTNLHTVSGHPLGSPREAIIAAMERQNEARREASSRSAR